MYYKVRTPSPYLSLSLSLSSLSPSLPPSLFLPISLSPTHRAQNNARVCIIIQHVQIQVRMYNVNVHVHVHVHGITTRHQILQSSLIALEMGYWIPRRCTSVV